MSVSGVTLIELLITMAILAVIISVGLPNLREFLVRSEVSTITTEFSSDIARTRIEAISRNGCVTMCSSTNTNLALNSPAGTPSCATSGNNWQTGWIIFSNPNCSTTLNTPNANNPLLVVRQAGSAQFQLTRGVSAMRRITFDSRGLAAGIQSNFTLTYIPEGINSPHYRTVCLSSAGRVTIKKFLESCP